MRFKRQTMLVFSKYKTQLGVMALIVFMSLFTGCKKFVQVDSPPNQVDKKLVFSDNAAAASALRGIYSDMVQSSGFASGALRSVTVIAGRSGDDFKNYSTTQDAEFSSNEVNPVNSTLVTNLWNEMFKFIYYANSAIEGLTSSETLTDSIRSQLIGEARFVRAFCNFYLVNLFGEIPIITVTDYRVNTASPKRSVDDIQKFIVTDLEEASTTLSDNYINNAMERVRPTKWAALAMLARTYLYLGEWDKAEKAADQVIANTGLYQLEPDLDKVFLMNSQEAIWQLIPTAGTFNTKEGGYFILKSKPTTVSISDTLLAAFEPDDLRKEKWIGILNVSSGTYYYPFKYKIKTASTLTEYSMVLRLAEQYLIRAEARIRNGNLSGGIADLDALRARANLPLIADTNPSIDEEDLLKVLLHERQVELFAEWGHRWLDLKRFNIADAVLSGIKGATWQPTDVLYPIPQVELNNNPNLFPQNQGYTF